MSPTPWWPPWTRRLSQGGTSRWWRASSARVLHAPSSTKRGGPCRASRTPRTRLGRSPMLLHTASGAPCPLGITPLLENTQPNAARRLIGATCASGSGWLTGADTHGVLSAYGIDAVPTALVRDVEAAVAEVERLGCPVALKAWGPAIVHKSDVGGVRLAVARPDAVRAAFTEMAARFGDTMEGAVIQPMVSGGVETIVGFVQNPEFGPQVVFGSGGTAVELLGDVVTRLAPLTDLDARDMVLGLRATPLLLGYRGSEPVDIEAVVDVVLRLGRLAEDLPEIAEADCNPMIATSAGAFVVDARMRVDRRRGTSRRRRSPPIGAPSRDGPVGQLRRECGHFRLPRRIDIPGGGYRWGVRALRVEQPTQRGTFDSARSPSLQASCKERPGVNTKPDKLERAKTEKEPDMRRKTFDMILSAGGAVLVVVLLVAGGLGLWGYSFANSNVHNQLAEQQITFPPKAAFAHPVAGHRDHAVDDRNREQVRGPAAGHRPAGRGLRR